MKNREQLESFLKKIVELRAFLKVLAQEIVEDVILVPIVFRALPSRFKVFVMTLNVTK